MAARKWSDKDTFLSASVKCVGFTHWSFLQPETFRIKKYFCWAPWVSDLLCLVICLWKSPGWKLCLSQMYKLLLLLTYIVEESLGKGNQVMIPFSQINASSTTNTLSTVHFRKALGRRKLLGNVGWEKWDCRSTTVTMLLYGCFSCTFNISLLSISQVWSMNGLTGSFHWSALWPQCLLRSHWWGFDVTLPPYPPGQDPQPPLGSHIAAWGCSHSSPQSTSPLWVKSAHGGWALPFQRAHAGSAWERST